METSLPLVAFVVAASVTPGPNNLMVLASGANWGLVRTLPHILGILLGFPVMIVAVGLGVSVVFEAAPWLHIVLKYLAFAYLCWLAWRIATAARPGETQGIRRPFNVWEAAAFQWVNPKAWTMILSGMAVFVDPAGNRAAASRWHRRAVRRCRAAELPRMGGLRPRHRPFPGRRPAAAAGSTSPWLSCSSPRRCRRSIERGARQPMQRAREPIRWPTGIRRPRRESVIRLLIATDAWRPQVNGVVRSIERLVDELPRLGAEVTILSPGWFRSVPLPDLHGNPPGHRAAVDVRPPYRGDQAGRHPRRHRGAGRLRRAPLVPAQRAAASPPAITRDFPNISPSGCRSRSAGPIRC